MRWPGITRFARVCVRFDDYHQSIDHHQWIKVLSEYEQAGLRGVIGVIPNYKGKRLSEDVASSLEEFQERGWEIAQHGFKHENIGEGRGGILYDNRSEFAGVDLKEQKRRIARGKSILQSHGFSPKTFIPPWHEYDKNTVLALAGESFTTLNEGRFPFPRVINGITLIPTHPPGITPEMLAVGVVTMVRHPHLDEDPMKSARILEGHENQVLTPKEIAKIWQDRKLKLF